MFSQTTEYALRAMAHMATFPDQLVSTVTIAERTKVPANYLAKVLQQLASAGLVAGRRGVGGGYKFLRELEDITLLDIVRAVDTIERVERCPLSEAGGTSLCALHKAMDNAAVKTIDALRSVTLRDLLEDASSKHRPMCGTAKGPR